MIDTTNNVQSKAIQPTMLNQNQQRTYKTVGVIINTINNMNWLSIQPTTENQQRPTSKQHLIDGQ